MAQICGGMASKNPKKPRGELAELQASLQSLCTSHGRSPQELQTAKRDTFRKITSLVSVGMDMSSLFPSMISVANLSESTPRPGHAEPSRRPLVPNSPFSAWVDQALTTLCSRSCCTSTSPTMPPRYLTLHSWRSTSFTRTVLNETRPSEASRSGPSAPSALPTLSNT